MSSRETDVLEPETRSERLPPIIAADVLARPLLRGWSHVVSFTVVLVIGLFMLALTDAEPAHRLLIVVYLLGTVCRQFSHPMPHIISESGRALTARFASRSGLGYNAGPRAGSR